MRSKIVTREQTGQTAQRGGKHPRQHSFLKYSSTPRQTKQNLTSAKKTRQHNVDKLMKSNKLSESAKLVRTTHQHYAVGPLKYLL